MKRAVILLLLCILLIGTAQAEWLDGWDYRQRVNISGSTVDITNYQVNLSVYNTTGSSSGSSIYIGNKANDDTYFTDLRVTTSDGTTLCPMWNETERANGWDIWVNVPSIPSSGTYLYVYYGNSSSSAIWSGVDTFIMFDHFDGSSLNTTTWFVNSGTPVVSNSILNYTNSDILSANNFVGSNSTVFGEDVDVTSSYSYMGYYIWTTGNNFAWFDCDDYGYHSITALTKNVSSTQSETNIGDFYGFHRYEISRNVSAPSTIYLVDGIKRIIHTTGTFVGDIGIRLYSSSETTYCNLDYVYVRNYLPLEPRPTTWYAEETAPTPTPTEVPPTSGYSTITISSASGMTTSSLVIVGVVLLMVMFGAVIGLFIMAASRHEEY